MKPHKCNSDGETKNYRYCSICGRAYNKPSTLSYIFIGLVVLEIVSISVRGL
jgi:hypothetical protein